MSFIKATCFIFGAVSTLLILYTQRQNIGRLLRGRKKAIKRGTVKSKKLDDDETYSVSYFEQGQPSNAPSLILFHGFTRY